MTKLTRLLAAALLSSTLLAPALVTAQDAAPAAAPAAAAAPAPADAGIRFQFDGTPYTEVVRRFSQMANKPLIGDLNIQGTLTFFDSEPYTYNEALDTLNLILAMRGYVLVESGRFLQLAPIGDLQRLPLRILPGLDQADDLRPGEVVTVALPLKFVDPEAAARAITPMVSRFGSIAALGRGQGLIVTDRIGNIQRIRTLLTALDSGTMVDRQMRTYPLKHASAREVAGLINNLFKPGVAPSDRQGRPQQQQQQQQAPPPPAVTATFDERTNLLVLIGTADQLALSENLIERLDVAANQRPSNAQVQVFELRNARAEVLVQTVRQAVAPPADAPKDQAPPFTARIVAEPQSNRLVVSAPPEEMAGIARVISELDQAATAKQAARVFRLQFADAMQLAAVVSSSFVRPDGEGRMLPRISVNADEKTNSLIVAGDPADLDQVGRFVAELDQQAQDIPRRIHVVKLQGGDARTIAGSLTRLYREQARTVPGAGARGRAEPAKVLVEADPLSNSLLIAASPEDWPTVQDILRQLDAQVAPSTTQTTSMITLQHAKATEVAPLLRQVFADRGRPQPGRAPTTPVNVAAAERSNTLVITASPDDLPRITQVIQSLDIADQSKVETVRIVQLQSADAAKLAATLQAMVPPAQRGQPASVVIQADPASNSLLLRAPEAQRELFEQLIQTLDASVKDQARQTRIIAVKHVSAAALANMLTQLFNPPAQRGQPRPAATAAAEQVQIVATPSDSALVVDAPSFRIEQIAQMVAAMDIEGAPLASMQTRTYQMQQVQAADLAQKLTRLFAEDRRNVPPGQPQPPTPRFEADARTNQLFVAAGDSQFTRIETFIKQVEAAQVVGQSTRVFALQFARCEEVALLLQGVLGQPAATRPAQRAAQAQAAPADEVRIASVAATNSVVVQASQAQMALAEQLIATIDVQQADQRVTLQVVQLQKAQAATLAQSLTASLASRARPQDRNAPAATPITVIAEPNSNSVLVRGPAAEIASVVEMIRQLDDGSQSAEVQMRVYPLRNGRASDLALALNRLLVDIARQRGRNQQTMPLSITSEDRTNSLVVSTTAAGFALVDQLLASLDQAPQKSPQDAQFILLRHADAMTVASNLQDLFAGRRLAERPVIEADYLVNAVTLIGTPDDLRSMEAIVAKLDQAARDDTVHVRVIPVTQGRADSMAEALRGVYAKVAPRDEADQGPQVSIEVDKAANALIVSGTRQQLEQIESLATRLASTAGRADMEYRSFLLEHAEPESVARALDDLFNPKLDPQAMAALRQQQQQQQQQPTPLRARPMVLSLPTPVLSAVADPRTRTVFVRAKPTEFEMIEAMIRRLDQPQTVASEVRVFALKNTDATEVAANLREMMRQAVDAAPAGGDANQQRAIRLQQAMRRSAPVQPGRGAAAAAADNPQAALLQVSANRQSNSVVVAAPTEMMTTVERIIEELDQSAAATRAVAVRLYPIAAGNVDAIAQTIQQVFSGDAGRGRGGNRAAAGPDATPVIVSAIPAARQILISATVERHDLIAKVLEDLTAAQGQVTAEVRVYRVEHADATQIAPALASTMSEQAPGRGRNATPGDDALRISADRSSNSLVVRASESQHEQLAQLLAQMDAPPLEQLPVQTVALNSGDPREVAAMLTRLFAGTAPGGRNQPGPRSPVSIEASRDARLLLVRADEATFEKVRALAAALDGAAPEGQVSRTVLPLTHAQAVAVAPALMQAFTPARGAAVRPEDAVTVVPEPQSNTLIVTASAANHEKVRSLLAALDTESASGQRVEIVVLKNGRAPELAPILTRVDQSSGGPARGAATTTTVSADQASNALVFSGPASRVSRLIEMATQLDEASEVTSTGVYVLPLTQGDAASMAAMVRDLYQQQVRTTPRGGKPADPLAISADPRANALVLATTKVMYETVSGWITQVEKMTPATGLFRVVPIQNAEPAEVEKAIRQMLNLPAAPAGGRGGAAAPGAAPGSGRGGIDMAVLPQQRALLVQASDEQVQAIRQLVEVLDKAADETKPQVRVFQLQHANNARVAASLAPLFRPAAGRAADPRDAVTITAMPQTTALIVAATPAKMDEVAALIEQIDKPEVAQQLEFRIFRLTQALPSAVLPMLRQLIAQIQRDQPQDPITVQGDDRTHSIVVTGRESAFEQIGQVIQMLDEPPQHREAQMRIVALKKADAARLATVLSEMLRPSATGQITPEARALQEQIRLLKISSPLHSKLPELDLAKPIKITANPGNNTLALAGDADNIESLTVLVEMMDVGPLGEDVKVRFMHLEHADALAAAQIVRDIFLQGQRLVSAPAAAGRAPRGEPTNVTGKALVAPINVSADPRTNTLILAGQEDTLALAELVVKDLDRAGAAVVTEVKLFRLRHADAAKLLPVLRGVFSEGAAAPGVEGWIDQVTRLQTVLDKGKGHATERPKTRNAVTIQSDGPSNTIIVSARGDVMPLIEDVINTLDVPGTGTVTVVRVYPLKHADATRVRQVVTDMFRGPAANDMRDEDKPTLSVDARTNALVATASTRTLRVIEALLTQLDTEKPVEVGGLRVIPLEHVEATALAPTIQRMMDARVQQQVGLAPQDAAALRVSVAADARSNSLIVAGAPESFAMVQQLVKQLDGAPQALTGEIRRIELKHADAGSLATNLQRLFDQRYAAAGGQQQQRQKPVILPDLRTNSLLVTASADDHGVITALLPQLDVKLESPAVSLTVIPMLHNDAAAVAPTLRTLFAARLTSMTAPGQTALPQNRVDIGVDGLTNSLIVSASRENLELIKGLLEKVDIEPPSETGVVRIYPLKNADGQRVTTILQSLLTQGLYKPGLTTAGANTAARAREKVALAVDLRTNVLIVSASRENFAVIEQILKQIDTTEEFAVGGDVRLFALKRAEAARLGPTLQQFFNAKRAAEQAAGGGSRSLPVTIIPDMRTNTLLVAGSRESFHAVETMIQQLDGDNIAMTSEFEVFPLKFATAVMLQPTIQMLFQQRQEREAGLQQRIVTVVADARTNSIVVGGELEDIEAARELIKRLDIEPPLPGAVAQIFPLAQADALEVANTLRTLYQASAAPGAPGLPGAALPDGVPAPPTVSISADTRLNAVVVSASPEELGRIGELVRQLDLKTPTLVTEIRVFPLRRADSMELAEVLNKAISSRLTAPPVPGAEAGVRQPVLQVVGSEGEGRRLLSSPLQAGISITPDRRTNSVVVSAPLDSMPLIENLIKSLDETQVQEAEIRVFKLKNADAKQMAELLQGMFRLRASSTAAGPGTPHAITYVLTDPAHAAGDQVLARATVGSAEQLALSVTVDVRTNSLLIGGSEQYVQLAERLIKDLDASPAQERTTRLYRLRNSQAADLETALRGFLDQERQRLVQALGKEGIGAAERLLEREVALMAEKTTNSLLVSANPRYFDTINDMIRELDQPPPQVLIEVLLAEVLLDDNDDLGFEWNVKFSADDLTGNVGSALGVANDFTKLGGFNVAVTGSDVSMILRALQEQGRLEVLSRPQLLAADNQPAKLNIGQQVPIVTNSRVSGESNPVVINAIEYRDVGVILNVTPRINDAGFVKLDVSPEISALSTSTVEISAGFNASIINNRAAKTTVTVQDGHTIIIGGLITVREEDRVKKVPVLGDVPVLGNLFKSRKTTRQRIELLVILKPHIIRTVEEADAVTAEQYKRAKALHNIETESGEDSRIVEPLMQQPTLSPEQINALQTSPSLKPSTTSPPASPAPPATPIPPTKEAEP
jgi:type II secretion system protein D